MNSDPVQQRLDSLTKPRGSLGVLETLVSRYCRITGETLPPQPRQGLYIFCGDHGVTDERVSAYPREVTSQMLANFRHGGAAINVLARQFHIEPVIVDCGVGRPTANFTREPAMTREHAAQLLKRGRALAHSARDRFDLAGVGEMGIGNSTAAAALLAVFARLPVADCVGPGAGLADLTPKRQAIERALALHQPDPADPLGVLAAIGGHEIATMAGFLLGASPLRLPVVVDGFIASSAVLIARAIDPTVTENIFFSHVSAEPGHRRMLAALNATAPLSLDLRLGEGSGAALLMNLLDTALKLYREMATFEEARVSNVE
mgnify:FL=1